MTDTTPAPVLVFAGQEVAADILARRAGLPVAELLARLSAGWPIAEAVSVPSGGRRRGDVFDRATDRPAPALRFHAGVSQWYTAFKVRGRRRVHYFGASRSVAQLRYKRWASDWPRPLLEGVAPAHPAGPRVIEFDGERRTLTAWARAVGLKPGTVRFRLDVLGWDTARALRTPTQAPLFARRESVE